MFDGIGQSFEMMFNNLILALPNVIKALLLLLLAWVIAVVVKAIIQKLFVKIGVAKGLAKTPMFKDVASAESMLEQVGKIVYFLVFILFLPAVFTALNMTNVSDPITNMMSQILNYIPNVIAAAVIILIGLFIAKLVKELFRQFFTSLNLDKWFNKVSSTGNVGESQYTISNVLANIIYIVLLIPFITIALEALNIDSISQPIQSVLDNVLSVIPSIFVAIILVLAGYYIGKFLRNIIQSLLAGLGLGQMLESLGFTNVKRKPFDIARFVGVVVQGLVLLFFTVEALNVINLEVLNTIGSAVIAYLPFLISALLIMGGGLLLANLIGNWVKNNMNSPMSAMIIKTVIIVFAVFMTLDQLQFATKIVNIAFLLILGGLMVAFAISFGLGGREFAKTTLAKIQTKFEKEDRTSSNEDLDERL